jgi:hypothetical protein
MMCVREVGNQWHVYYLFELLAMQVEAYIRCLKYSKLMISS